MRRNTTLAFSFTFTFTLLSQVISCGPSLKHAPIDVANLQEAWNAANDPLTLRDHYEVNFGALPLTGELERKPWTDTYWPSYRAGIADRWNDPTKPDPFTYALSDAAAVRAMDVESLKLLSPAEKYDILVGRYDYPLVTSERQRTRPDNPTWFGLCHGWAPASLNFDEPKPTVIEGAGGVKVPFGSSDIKALLLYAQQQGRSTRYTGQRCNRADSPDADVPECRDINAGSFHIILSNQIALVGEGFVADVSRAEQVWNQPIYAFSSKVLEESTPVYAHAAPGTVKIVTVQTEMRYIAEMSPQWAPRPYTDYPEQASERTYSYTLELNDASEIIGGEWTSSDHPDFVWIQSRPTLTGYFAKLRAVYESAIQP